MSYPNAIFKAEQIKRELICKIVRKKVTIEIEIGSLKDNPPKVDVLPEVAAVYVTGDRATVSVIVDETTPEAGLPRKTWDGDYRFVSEFACSLSPEHNECVTAEITKVLEEKGVGLAR